MSLPLTPEEIILLGVAAAAAAIALTVIMSDDWDGPDEKD